MPKVPLNDVNKFIVRVQPGSFPSLNTLSISINDIIQPHVNKSPVIDPRLDTLHDIENPSDNLEKDIIEKPSGIVEDFDLPSTIGTHEEKQAVKATVQIKRLQMKKHRRRKWLRKNKFAHAKKLLYRFTKKETKFRAKILRQIKQSEKFSAEQYVLEKLEKAKPLEMNKFYYNEIAEIIKI